MPTPAAEDYLMAIYALRSEGQRVIGARLAEVLKVKPSTVTAAVRRLQRDGQVTLHSGKTIAFTDQGQKNMEGLIRRHRLAERWLADVLGIGWHECHEEAHRLEHALSDRVADRLSRALGNPSTCPHGSPIPGNPTPRSADKLLLLSDVSPGQEVTVERVSELMEFRPEFLKYLDDHGLRPGVSVRVTNVEAVSGLLLLQLKGRRATVSREIADRVWVRQLARRHSSANP